MKECPICHSVYDDNLNFCVKDGHELIDKPVGSQQTSQFQSGGTNQSTTKSKKGDCLKKVIIAAVVVVIGSVSLYRYMMNATTYLRVEPTSIVAAKCGGKASVAIDFDGYVWSINHKPDWVDVDEDDNHFELTFLPNTSGSIQEGAITIQSGSHIAQVQLTQMAYATYIKTSVSALKFGKRGGSETVKIESDGTQWTVDYPNFLNLETAGDGFTVEVLSNAGDYRQGFITITEDNVRTTIPIQQAGKCPNCHGQGSMTCTICGGTGSTGYGMFYMQCGWCGGRGSINCGVCGGTGEKE